MNEKFAKLGFSPADILLPKNADMEKWSVVACDQYTSEPEYWQRVDQRVGDAPGTLRLILPEANLKSPDVAQHIARINETMDDYLTGGVFAEYPRSLIYVERLQSDGKLRKGLVGMVDLEQFEFVPGSDALIRSTEGIVPERIPPRVQVRKDAALELPHVMLLIDDPDFTVIEPLHRETESMEKLYDFELMENGGHLAGYLLDSKQIDAVADALEQLCTEEAMQKKYGMKGVHPLLFAVGDGNHSLVTAKECYNRQKQGKTPEEYLALPARYALVEVVNNHDAALEFEAIHRVLFGVDKALFLKEFKSFYPNAYEGKGAGHTFRMVCQEGECFVTVPDPTSQLTVRTLQVFLDEFVKTHPCEIDYIHGDDTCCQLGRQSGNLGLLLPAMGKEQLFKTVIADGNLPRKTFSMGHAWDKRYYTESRKIR